MANSKRHILEGEWTGYSSSQRRVVHREEISGKRVDRLRALHAIVYTDGTSLLLDLRPAKPREKVEPIRGYDSLIRKAEALSVETGRSRITVAELNPA